MINSQYHAEIVHNGKPLIIDAATPAPLSGKYAALRDAIIVALAAGRATEDAKPDDGGTCNFDAPALVLPRWNAAKIQQVAKEAGSSAFAWNLYGSKLWVLRINSGAQGNARTTNAEAACASLTAAGYDCHMYYQMD